MQAEEYTFVTLDGDDTIPADAVVVDVEGGVELGDAVMLDDNHGTGADHADFITLTDDTVMLSDADTVDLYSTDMDSTDISFII